MAVTSTAGVLDLILPHVERDPAHPCLIWQPLDGPPRHWNYGAFFDAVRATAAGLTHRGVRPGDRVLLHADNSPEFLFAWLACAWVGAVCVVTNPKSAGPELAWFAAHTDAVGAVTQPQYADVLGAHAGGMRWIWTLGADPGVDAGAAPADAPRAVLPGRAAGSMMFTSGTTSRPKAVLWSRANAAWAAESGVRNARLVPQDVVQVFVPLYHVVGLAWSVLPALAAGATVLLQPRFSASRFWPVAKAHGATIAAHVQFSSRVLSDMPAPERHGFRLWGNSTWLESYARHFGVPIMGWWGMTEVVAPGIVGVPGRAQPSGSIGWPAPGYEVRIVDDHGRPAPDGEPGHLLLGGVPGETIFAEYFGNPEATREAFTEDGWFRTGDRVLRHAGGAIAFVERARDVIKTGGEGVSPAEVERVVKTVDGVAQVAVVGRPDPVWGEVGVAFVVAAGEAPAATLRERILAQCQASLASFKVPREVVLLDALPRVGIDKIAKGELRAMAAAMPLGPDPSSRG